MTTTTSLLPTADIADGPGKILYLTHHLPWPALSGGTVREYQLLVRMQRRFTIDLIAVEKRGIPLPQVRNPLGLESVTVHRDESAQTLRRQRHSGTLRKSLRTGLGEAAEVVHIEGGYLAHMVPPPLLRRVCLVEHNIESAVLRQFAKITDQPRLERSTARVARLEERLWTMAAAVVVTTEEDRDDIRRRTGRTDVHVVPNGCDHLHPAPADAQPATAPVAILLGNFAYRPTADALNWLLDEIWPAVRAAVPTARLHLVGTGISTTQRRAALSRPGVIVIGPVDNVGPELDRAHVFIAPLRAGGGVKMKVLEALRRGCPVVTTSSGAQGIHGHPRSTLRISDEPAELAAHVVSLLPPKVSGGHAHRRDNGLSIGLPTWSSAAASLALVWNEVARSRVR